MDVRAIAWHRWIAAAAVCGALFSFPRDAAGACPNFTAGSTTLYTTCGLVGVGSTAPIYNFDVYNSSASAEAAIRAGVAADTGLWLIDTNESWKVGVNVFGAGAGKFTIFDRTQWANRLIIDTAGNVGIGTATPNVTLDVNGRIAVQNSGTSATAGAQLRTYLATDSNWGISNTASSGAGGDEYHVRIHGWGVSPANKRQFQVVDSANSNAVRFAVNFYDGRVGIGTTNPAASLDVVGSENVSGNVTAGGTISGANVIAKYQDVAEWVHSGHRLEPSTVVVLDASHPAGVVPCESSYDTRVAGVVSASPGVVLGEAGIDKSLVATTGRVKVKVDAGMKPVRVGDLLVTSDREGYAMRSDPIDLAGVKIHRPGTLIGKALEPLETGQGEILVLLSLQ